MNEMINIYILQFVIFMQQYFQNFIERMKS
jgi:hypothetical protein